LDYKSFENTTACTLVSNLPDIKQRVINVALPPFLIEKWKKEGRYEQEIKELDAFFVALDIQELQNITSSNGLIILLITELTDTEATL
jgi:sensor domain CHASE-containing protein